ncbi:MAG: glycerol-3-phosphate dehydrogenase, partial [Clostridia bacterium]|nr:glycerol-3-phosphate dehydrogenase [Clostridia bacterium]
MNKVCIMGAGAFGTSMKNLLIRNGHNPLVWKRGEDVSICKDMDFVIFAVPAQSFRSVFTMAAPFIGNAIVINLAKGIENGTLLRMSEVAEEILPGVKYVALSGPSHAEEIEKDVPTDVTIASLDEQANLAVQDLLFTNHFRVYTNNDIVGVELGGSIKNVIALTTGIADGMGFGDNSRAAL